MTSQRTPCQDHQSGVSEETMAVVPNLPLSPQRNSLQTEELRQLLEKLDGLDAKRTKGPWGETRPLFDKNALTKIRVAMETLGVMLADDAAFIVALENAYPTLRAMLSAAPVVKNGGEWRTDMENAPRDGTEILAAWDAPTPEYKARGVVFCSNGRWLTSPGHWVKDITHWQPLPTPPSGKEQGG